MEKHGLRTPGESDDAGVEEAVEDATDATGERP
jgi:hypothetical protein